MGLVIGAHVKIFLCLSILRCLGIYDNDQNIVLYVSPVIFVWFKYIKKSYICHGCKLATHDKYSTNTQRVPEIYY